MRKFIVLVLGLFFISGCLVRTYETHKPRKDLEITGNRGYVMGEPKEEIKPSSLGDKRPVTVIEIEYGPHQPKATEEEAEGSVEGGEVEFTKLEDLDIEEEIVQEEVISVDEIGSKQVEYTYYTVKENDTLQKISHKFYGTTRKWKFIYENNKDVLKNPDKLYPGKTIKIPVLK